VDYSSQKIVFYICDKSSKKYHPLLITHHQCLTMPSNKNALERYLILDEKLRSNRRHTLEQLADTCSEKLDMGISARTISDDLRYMRDRFNAPIPKRPIDGLFDYTDRRFSILNSPLKDKQVAALKKALHILRQFEYLPQFHDIQDIILNLETRSKAQHDVTNDNIIAFDRSDLAGIHFLSTLYECMLEKHPLHVGYTPYEGDNNDAVRFADAVPFERGRGFSFHLHPYFLKEFNHRWFVFGWNEERQSADCYALDRFQFVRPLELRPFIPNKTIDFAHYFEHIIGVTHIPDYAIESYRMCFRKPRAFYVRTKKWKPTQIEIEETDDSITFEWQKNTIENWRRGY
jgi:predicted DNA-binding transcriptional regulator YafY